MGFHAHVAASFEHHSEQADDYRSSLAHREISTHGLDGSHSASPRLSICCSPIGAHKFRRILGHQTQVDWCSCSLDHVPVFQRDLAPVGMASCATWLTLARGHGIGYAPDVIPGLVGRSARLIDHDSPSLAAEGDIGVY